MESYYSFESGYSKLWLSIQRKLSLLIGSKNSLKVELKPAWELSFDDWIKEFLNTGCSIFVQSITQKWKMVSACSLKCKIWKKIWENNRICRRETQIFHVKQLGNSELFLNSNLIDIFHQSELKFDWFVTVI